MIKLLLQRSYKEGTKKVTNGLKIRSKGMSKVFGTQNATNNVCVMNLGSKTYQVKCYWGIYAW